MNYGVMERPLANINDVRLAIGMLGTRVTVIFGFENLVIKSKLNIDLAAAMKFVGSELGVVCWMSDSDVQNNLLMLGRFDNDIIMATLKKLINTHSRAIWEYQP